MSPSTTSSPSRPTRNSPPCRPSQDHPARSTPISTRSSSPSPRRTETRSASLPTVAAEPIPSPPSPTMPARRSSVTTCQTTRTRPTSRSLRPSTQVPCHTSSPRTQTTSPSRSAWPTTAPTEPRPPVSPPSTSPSRLCVSRNTSHRPSRSSWPKFCTITCNLRMLWQTDAACFQVTQHAMTHPQWCRAVLRRPMEPLCKLRAQNAPTNSRHGEHTHFLLVFLSQ
mmetsp:Transcript_23862/g.66675  ORF Transcript_23862/g.66675 Transcript_23862/m.66675 type:complete len:224 (+) Transcript_23862:954-1625(+)